MFYESNWCNIKIEDNLLFLNLIWLVFRLYLDFQLNLYEIILPCDSMGNVGHK